MMRAIRRRRGWVFIDAITALAIVLIMLAVLATAVSRQRRGAERLAETRAAVRMAEDTLTALQSSVPPPAAPQGVTVTVHPTEVQPALPAPAGSEWVEVTIAMNGRSTTLSGIVRADVAKGASK
jgi:type II secretory pathway pseudopilin PulG